MTDTLRPDDDQVVLLESIGPVEIIMTDDALEGPRAFAEKRAPEWIGR